MNFVGKRAVVYGAGASGLSAYDLLKDKGASVIVYDDDIGAQRATSSVGVFKDADIIVLSPGVDGSKDFILDAKLENKLVIGELELASRCCYAEQIAVTGTNGKTTTTTLIDYIFKRAGRRSHAVGNIGTPFSAIADKLDAEEVAIIEASSFQLESSICFSPDTAVFLNVAPDHLERHGSFEKYVEAKANIFLNQGPQDFIVYNDDDDTIRSLTPRMKAQKLPFSMTHPVTSGAYVSSGFLCWQARPIVSVNDVDMRGKELENALAAIAVCISHGISDYCVASALTEFTRPKYRRQRVGSFNGIEVIDDSKATNVSACLSACCGTEKNTVLILGGAKREENFDNLFDGLPKTVLSVCAYGENADCILEAAQKARFENIVRCGDLSEALCIALKKAESVGAEEVLFSPASKSFDAFSGYEQRGERFDAYARELGVK